MLRDGVNWAVWRAILGKVGTELFEPGNEARLAKARERFPRLDQALKRFGPPPKALLQKMKSGPSFMKKVPYDASQALPVAQMKQFFEQGYCVARGAVPPSVTDAALRHINASLGRNAIEQTTPNLTNLEKGATAEPAITNLFYASSATHLVESLLGPGNAAPVRQGQVALRFPTEGPCSSEEQELRRGRAYHVDGFAKGLHSPFTVLVGVCLSDQPQPLCGNLAVHPGAHWRLQSQVRDLLGRQDDDLARKPDLGPPTTLLLRKGDVVLCHQKLPHLGQSNYSPHVRYQVYFRVKHVHLDDHRDRWLDDLLLPFDGLRAALLLPQQ